VRRRIEFLVKNNERKKGYGFKHLTLTIRSRSNLPKMLASLGRSFRRLRQRRLWRNSVAGGAFVFEVTSREGYYHAHIHAVIYARYIDWQRLLDLWIQVSDGRGVFIQSIPPHQICRYLTKYISKPAGQIHIEQEAQDSLSGFRLFSPFGSWYNLSKQWVDDKPGCPECGHHCFLPFDLLYCNLRSAIPAHDTS